MRVEPCPHCAGRAVDPGSWDWPECEQCGTPLAVNESLFTEGWFVQAGEWVYWNEVAVVSSNSYAVQGAATRIPNEIDLDNLNVEVKLHSPRLFFDDNDLLVKRSSKR